MVFAVCLFLLGGFLDERLGVGNALLEFGLAHLSDDGVSGKGALIRLDIHLLGISLGAARLGALRLRQCVFDALYNLLRRDVVVAVVFQLNTAAAVGLVDGALHALGDGVGVHDDLTVDIAGCAASGLRQTAVLQEPLPVNKK